MIREVKGSTSSLKKGDQMKMWFYTKKSRAPKMVATWVNI